MTPTRTTVITGGNTGIGLETAVGLASLGDRVVICCRNATKATAAVEEIRIRSGNDCVEWVPLDLASMASVRACAAVLAERAPVIDVLINNAGLILSTRQETENGFESTFGTNHLGHFLLTTLLEPQVTAAAAPRVINVASIAHCIAVGGLDFDDLQTSRRYYSWFAYGRSKLANIYFTQELARRWARAGVKVHALHPGPVNSHFGRDGDTRGIDGVLMKLAPLVMISPEKGARTSIWVATSPEGGLQTGAYWVRCRRGRLFPWAKRPADARRLWEISERFVAQGHP
ncbi:MAG TPA: SDR family oxidoreductase [Microthrixaceae bacterium]|nr:SDR family oxidoreductase [Microthrixaceae bacterium]